MSAFFFFFFLFIRYLDFYPSITVGTRTPVDRKENTKICQLNKKKLFNRQAFSLY